MASATETPVAPAPVPETPNAANNAKQPPAIICVGMAGSGKTTFMQRLNAHLHTASEPPYILNLDPAVRTLPFSVNIDIRDSINYKEVMSTYNLGPNGGIMTCLNLFATKVDQVVGILETRANAGDISRILVDTPGQIECFVWSASGAILLDSIASSFPTVVAYIVDTPRTASPSTFMANMVYACSILYKTKLPMIIVFNKTDVHDADFAKEWMTDFEAFQAALQEAENSKDDDGTGSGGYMGSLLNSMSLMLDEFYKTLSVVGVSAMTGQGIDDFLAAVDEKVMEYNSDYLPELVRMQEEKKKQRQAEKEKELERMMADLEVEKDKKKKGKKSTEEEEVGGVEAEVLSDFEEGSEEGEGIVERDEDEPPVGEDEEGLQDRYARALNERGGNQEEQWADVVRQTMG
ncbi:hypothetical protein BJ508DRAFT_418140 [Ascobolus immersus RN42]|uniref:GPN-loop GTPase n=1 Tax=Ascobolus immersus RN42 TaxID=1160509 RepID=A0A3N4HNH9_ASCIM|nr:hypothetical protein BJ508DRAFT_418140 [Ascobolus immersus RN42]